MTEFKERVDRKFWQKDILRLRQEIINTNTYNYFAYSYQTEK